MEINVLINKDYTEHLKVSWLRSIVGQVLLAQNTGPKVELGLVITNQEMILQLNRSYRSQDRPTDVLSFSLLPEPLTTGTKGSLTPFVPPPDGVLHLGEVIISYPQAVIQAEEHRHSVTREIAILIIHGILHILGYDHNEDELEKQMKSREAAILESIEGELP